MNYLADTYILIWALRDDAKLSSKAKEILLNANNTIYCSIISIWEIAIKYTLHKEDFSFSSETFYSLCVRSGYNILNLETKHIFAMEALERFESEPRHRDPFDRLLLAQAKSEKMNFLSHGALMEGYHESCLVRV